MVGYDRYEMKQMYDSPLKIKKVFSGKNDDQSIFLRNGLWKLFNEVLFIQDTERNGFYHPRFGANESYIYQMLSETERDAFNRIYDDFFFHRHNDFWYNGALKKLSALTSSTRMLVCAEDLGMVPDCVDVLLNKLGILSLEIQSMPKRTDEEFSHLESNPYNSVATITTHDMSPMRAWWEENAERAQRYYHQILQKDGIAPTVMPDWLCEEVISRHMFSPSMLCLISLQDWLSIDESTRRENPKDERINVPSDAHNKWDYRMHLTIEALKQKRRLNEKIKLLVERSGRE
jgi:4-alpha-glucanotransferase